MPFTFLLRTQFSFKTSSSDFNSVLKSIADEEISITAYNIKQRKNCVRVLLVVGLPNSTEKDAEWNRKVKSILRRHDICYTRKKIVQASGVPSGVTGVISSIYDALYEKVQIYNIYLGEDTNRMIDTNNNKRVIRLLSEL
jgi:hypothetical protein